MSAMFTAALWIILSYLLGSIPVGILLSRLKGQDPRKVGSGNIGATNVMRTAGKALGIITLLGDAAKGFIPTLLAKMCGFPATVVAAAGLAAFLGHVFPLYLKFKGGKGMGTAVGVLLVINPLAVVVNMAIFAVVLKRWGYVSLGSLLVAALMPVFLFVLKTPWEYLILCLMMVVVIFVKHYDNIRRLREGTESKVFRK
jgi:acyl phosphate:glycerol-3-phosphate acyltransferase